MTPATFAAAGALVAALGVAQEPAKPASPLRLLLGQRIVDGTSLQEIGGLGYPGSRLVAQWLGAQSYRIGDSAVDLTSGHVLEQNGANIRLRTTAGRELWTVSGNTVGAALGPPKFSCLLTPDRVVLPRPLVGLVALDRSSGAVAWQQPACPNRMLVADGELVLATGPLDGKPTLSAFALRNGARAFSCKLPVEATRLVAGPHGIAVVSAGEVTVYDRSGPALFTAAVAEVDLVAGRDGWFVASREALEAWDRRGQVVWRRPLVVDTFTGLGLAVADDGSLLELRHCPISDSGVAVACHEPRGGEVLWRYQDPGLGVAHSKYWHRVHARASGDAVFVVSQAAGGNFVVELDATTGEKQNRVQFGL